MGRPVVARETAVAGTPRAGSGATAGSSHAHGPAARPVRSSTDNHTGPIKGAVAHQQAPEASAAR